MARIPESVIEQVRERADIVSVIERYVTLRKAGSQFVGLCPFHEEKTPSFQVSPAKQVFYCFGCQAGGNVFSFLMRHNGLEFPESVETLAQDLGIAIPRGTQEGSGRSAALFAVNDAALGFFRERLRASEGRAAREHLSERGIPEDLVDRFQLGFAPAKWDALMDALRDKREHGKAAVDVGLVKKRETGTGFYDAFRGRVMFPILEPGGRVIGFGGRALSDDGPKYINSPESPVYQKSRVLFGLPQALDAIRQRERAIVVEGYFDVMALHRAGLPEAVAPCGTAMTAEHARRLRRYASEVVLLFDGDAAGERAARRCLPLLLAEGLRVRAAFLPEGEDPDTLVRESGGAALRACVEAAVPLLDELIERAVKGVVDHAWAAGDVSRELAPLIRAIPDAVERAAYTRKLSSYLELPPGALAEQVRSSGERQERRPASELPPREPGQRIEIDRTVRELLRSVLSYPETVRHLERVESNWIDQGIDRELLSVVSAAAQTHGSGAVAFLLSPDNEETDEGVATALAEIAAHEPPENSEVAERAAHDCVVQLHKRMLTRKLVEVKRQAEPDLELIQEYKAEISRLETSLTLPNSSSQIA